MSDNERKWWKIWSFVFMFLCAGLNLAIGKHIGRAEQKKGDAAWYAAQQVMKEGEMSIIESVPDATHFVYTCTVPAPAPPAKPKSHRLSYLRLLPDISDGLLEHESGRIIQKLEGATSIEKSDVFVATGMLRECVKRLKQKSYVPVMWDCGDGKPTTAPCPAEKP